MDFEKVLRRARQRKPQLVGPQELSWTDRIYSCECCQDSGVVKTEWLNRWGGVVPGLELDPIMSIPVYCRRLRSCGVKEIQVFADNKDTEEDSSRTAKVNLFDANSKDTAVGSMITDGTAIVLTPDQSNYLHRKVLEYREILGATADGQQYVNDTRDALRAAGQMGSGQSMLGLTHIGDILGSIPDLPTQPDFDYHAADEIARDEQQTGDEPYQF